MHVHAILYDTDVRKLADGVYAVTVKHIGDDRPYVSEDQLENLVVNGKVTRIVMSKEEVVNGLVVTKPFTEPKRIVAVYIPKEFSSENVTKLEKVDFSNEEVVAYGLDVKAEEMQAPFVMIEFENGELMTITKSEFAGEKAVKVSPMKKKKKKKSTKGEKNARKAGKRSKKSKAKSTSS